ncbi:MAG TPA: ATP-binding protein [Anaerolineaceae bacterium]|nr:ATP-binding protein [Anaerolineaceae bacterium]
MVLFLGILAWLVRSKWDLSVRMPWQKWLILAVLTAVSPLVIQFLGFNVPFGNVLPVPGVPADLNGPFIFLLACFPFVLASGFLGTTWATFLGALAGLFVALAETHQAFTILEYAGLAFAYSLAIRQPYRRLLYRILRHPMGSALFVGFSFIPIYILSSFFATPGSIEARLDYALTQAWWVALLRGLELALASILAEAFYLFRVPFWHQVSLVFPSPEERSLRVKFFYGTVPMLLVLFFALTAGDWVVAGDAARKAAEDRMSATSEVVSASIPLFLETGHEIMVSLATPDLTNASTADLPGLLKEKIRIVGYFTELAVFGMDGEVISAYPNKLDRTSLTPEEQSGVDVALKGVYSQDFVVPHLSSDTSVLISYVNLIMDAGGNPHGVLVARTDFNTNTFTIASFNAMDAIKESMGGEGAILDANGTYLYSPVPANVGQEYQGRRPSSTEFFDEVGVDGTRRLVYYQPVSTNSWAVVLTIPASYIQRQALTIAFPLLIILVVISIGMFIFSAASLRVVSASLRSLSDEAGLISRGQLDHSLQVRGEDEVGQLSLAFENMRQSLKARMDELNSLLLVSQGIASNLKVDQALATVLDAALANGAASARVVLVREVALNLSGERLYSFGKGLNSDAYAYLDEQIFDFLKQQPMLSIPNTTRIRRFNIPPGCLQPGALIGMGLIQKNAYYGALWLAYDQPRNFSEAEVRFLGTLAGQSSLAAANASLYANAEIGRQRLMAVLSSSPEPVLVLDEKMRLLLLNSAARQIPGLVRSAEIGRPVKDVVASLELLELIAKPLDGKLAAGEITLSNGRVYYASVSPVGTDNLVFGRVCVLQDVTKYKELDTMKNDFVVTVSHDLRAPLTLMRGYVTMFQMLGDLNEQQKSFMKKIVVGVDEMSRLVNNLLNLARIETGMALQYSHINAQEIVGQVLTSLQPQATQQTIHLEHTTVTLPPIYLEADRDLLIQAITNLVENAIKYSNVKGTVKVSIQPRPNSVVFIVQDNGIGIAPLDLPRVFEKFYRSGRREAHQQRGSGLGLAIVKSVAERHNGKVSVESQLGKGSTFYLEIPLTPKK